MILYAKAEKTVYWIIPGLSRTAHGFMSYVATVFYGPMFIHETNLQAVEGADGVPWYNASFGAL